jgi:23S rRNA pseudouridine1911/1915/1917 synthase
LSDRGGEEPAREPARSLLVPPELDGERVDRALARLLPEISRAEAHRAIEAGQVRNQGQTIARPSLRLRAGDRIEVDSLPRPPSTLEPEPIPLDVRYEDEHLIVLVKPAGLVMHPGAGARRGTLVAGLLARYGTLPGDATRPGLVHRLDRGTTGLLVVARSALAHRRLAAAVAARQVERRYEALVWGEPRASEGSIEVPITRSRRNRTRMVPARTGGRPAATDYRVIEFLGIASRVELTLRTGRTHQIRVHLKHLGYPVLGDPTYGGRPRNLIAVPAAERGRARRLLAAIQRQALNASRLAFVHPITQEALAFEAARPDDMEACLGILRGGSDG